MAEAYTETLEQLNTQCTDRHLSVTANAGSGKTTVLKKRFVNILSDNNANVEPHHLIAITFTRKAASDIFAKIAKEIEESIQKSQSREEHASLIQLRELLNTAYISTIHSFCSSIIRDFPIESGVSPNFTEINEAEKKRLEDNAVTETLAENMEVSSSVGKQLKEIMRAFGRKNVEVIIKDLLNKKDIIKNFKQMYDELSYEQISEQAVKEIIYLYRDKIVKSIPSMIKILSEVTGLNIDSSKKQLIPLLIETLDGLAMKLNNLEQIDIENLKGNISDVASAVSLLNENKILTQENALSGTTFTKRILDNELMYSYNLILKQGIELILNLIIIQNLSYHKQLIEQAKIIVDMAVRANDLIENEKDESGVLDFDDLLIKARDMLKDEKVCEKIRRIFRYIMVDEFQDTNDIQYDIIKSLVPELTNHSHQSHLKLFIVGDPKQSIYGFRNADVRVFKKATEDIKNINKYLLEQNILTGNLITPSGEINSRDDKVISGELELTVSFRHSPVIAAFTNIVCGTLFANHESDYDVQYSPLVCTKTIPELKDYISKNKYSTIPETQEFGSVSFIYNINPEKENGNTIDSEVDTLSRKILNLTTDNAGLQKYKFSDIGVIARTKSKLKDLAICFQKYNIPYILHSGKGFYETQEVMDILSILKFLHNPKDDLALSGALRSPYFGVTDSLLITISGQSKNKSLWEKLVIIAAKDSDDYPIARRAFNILAKLQRFSSRLSISHLISQIIELCGWYGAIAGSPGLAQIKANVQKIKQYAAEFEKRGFKGLFDFVEEINMFSKESVSESEAVFITDDNAVNIMTIHGAKGLEFPVVVLYDSNAVGKDIRGTLIDDDFGLAFKVPVYNYDSKQFDKIETPLYKIVKEKQLFKEKAELKRLLYVALTRAKNHLIISATKKRKNSSNTLFNMILEGLNITEDDLFNDDLSFHDELSTYHEAKIESLKFEFPVTLIKGIDIVAPIQLNEPIEREFKTILFGDIKAIQSDDTFSATRIITFMKNERKYLDKYILGFYEDLEDYHLSSEDEAERDIKGAEAGTLFHSVMERISKWLKIDGTVNTEELENSISDALFMSRKLIDESQTIRIRKEINDVIATNLIQENVEKMINSKTEVDFTIPFEGDFINAKIDLLYRICPDEFEVWDWKTNNVKDKDEMIALAGHYEFQMKLYAYLLMLMNNNNEIYKSRLLFTQMAEQGIANDDWTYIFKWTKNDLLEFEKELTVKIANIKSLNYS